MLHYLYKTICLVNQKYYLGIHSTENINDGYFGSGIALQRAIKKYGKEQFQKEIIAFVATREELLEMEKNIITEKIVKDKKSYNMVIGGNSAVDYYRQQGNDFFIKHQQNAGKKGAASTWKKMTEEERKKWHVKGGQAMHKKLRDLGLPHPTKGKPKTKETKQRMSEAAKLRPKHPCPFCDRFFDAGNLKIHLKLKH